VTHNHVWSVMPAEPTAAPLTDERLLEVFSTMTISRVFDETCAARLAA
jgi:TPP-dependent pyruvate/acetoin dehydrogenase alpha subunit